MKEIETIIPFFDTPKSIFITTHRKPDGDAMGSVLALYHYFTKFGHTVFAISPTDWGSYLNWMPSVDKVIDYEKNQDLVKDYLSKSDIVFCLDFNGLGRIDGLGELIKQSPLPKIMIDHHPDAENFDDYRLYQTSAMATCELVFEFIRLSNRLDLLDKNLATCIYTGIMTDSGSFKYKGVSANLHRIIARLMDCDIDHTQIHSNIYDTMTENRIRFFGYCMVNKLEIIPEYKTAIVWVDKSELYKYNIQTGDTEGLVNYPLQLEGIVLVALVIERSNEVKLSFRSKGSFAANKMMQDLFTGGGHFNAAGGTSQYTIKETVNRIKEALPSYKEKLLSV